MLGFRKNIFKRRGRIFLMSSIGDNLYRYQHQARAGQAGFPSESTMEQERPFFEPPNLSL
jgi:hypothetical protein